MTDSPRRSRRLAGLPPTCDDKPRAVEEAIGLSLQYDYNPHIVQACEKVVVGFLGVLTTIPLLKMLF